MRSVAIAMEKRASNANKRNVFFIIPPRNYEFYIVFKDSISRMPQCEVCDIWQAFFWHLGRYFLSACGMATWWPGVQRFLESSELASMDYRRGGVLAF
jgi:hypothetical protein